jgi:hypothetical protein
MIPSDFSYELQHTPSGSITITSGYSDPMVSKRFIEIISSLFGPITDQRYQLNGYTTISEKPISLPDIHPMVLMMLLMAFIVGMSLGIGSWVLHPNALNMIFPWLGVLIIIYIAYHSLKERIKKNALKMIKEFWEKNIPTWSIWLPQILVSNEEKRKLFLWKIKLQTTSGAWYYRFIENPLYFMIAGIFAIPLIIATLFLFSINTAITFWILCIIIMIGIPITHQIIVYLKNKKLRSLFPAHPVGEITLVEPADIGKASFLTSKIEKLWI